jgi:hypothetical protein
MTDRTDAELIKSYLEKIDALEVKLAATQGAYEESLVQLLATLDEIAGQEAKLRDCLNVADEYAGMEQKDHLQFRPYSSPMFYAGAIRDRISEMVDAARAETTDGGEEENG